MKRSNRRQFMAGLSAVAALSVLGAPALAQNFPTQPIRVIVPFPAGGTTDVAARIFAAQMQEQLGQPMVIENRGGGGGSVGADVVARATPDGHTLLFHNITFSATTTLMAHQNRALHTMKDFEPISIAVNVPMLLLAHPSLGVTDLKGFVEVARNRQKAGNPIFYGSTGPGSIINLVGEVIKNEAKLQMDHVPFPGAAPLVKDLLSGRVQFGGDQLSTSLEHARAGRLTPLAVMAGQRSPALPNVPTVGEMGFASLNLRGFNGFIAPAGTPRPVIDRIRQAVVAAAKHPDVIARLQEMGAEPSASTPEEFKAVLTDQVAKMQPLVAGLPATTK